MDLTVRHPYTYDVALSRLYQQYISGPVGGILRGNTLVAQGRAWRTARHPPGGPKTLTPALPPLKPLTCKVVEFVCGK